MRWASRLVSCRMLSRPKMCWTLCNSSSSWTDILPLVAGRAQKSDDSAHRTLGRCSHRIRTPTGHLGRRLDEVISRIGADVGAISGQSIFWSQNLCRGQQRSRRGPNKHGGHREYALALAVRFSTFFHVSKRFLLLKLMRKQREISF